MPDTFDRVALAQRLQKKSVPKGPEYTQAWTSFNAFYDGELDNIERDRAMNSIRKYVSEDQANSLLASLSDAISFFTQLPPGNTKLSFMNPNYRMRSRKDLEHVGKSCLVVSLDPLQHNTVSGLQCRIFQRW